MITVDQALAAIESHVQPGPTESVPLVEALGRVLAQPVDSDIDSPPFDKALMDGFAVRADDVADGTARLTVIEEVTAGQVAGKTVTSGQAIQIMTGAPMPPGADAVVEVERTSVSGDGSVVTVAAEVPVGKHVRSAGDDLRPGDEVVGAGTTLGPGHLGVLASIGVERVVVFRRLRVGVLSTGDELVDGSAPLMAGQIRDANRPALLGLLDEMGVVPVDLGRVADDEAAIARALLGGVDGCDAVLTSGGVSMGDFDYVKVVLDRIGEMRWMQVAVRPAKPLAFGLVDGVPVFGLPGNPVSSMVSFELFARPALRAMSGHRGLDRPRVEAVVVGELRRRADGKVHFGRVVVEYLDGRYLAWSAGGQGSHQLAAMATATGLAILPDGDGMSDGDEVEVILLG